MSMLNERSREIFRQIIDAYIMTGDPVGSATLSQKIQMSLSPAGITPSALIQAANYINSKLLGHDFEDARTVIEQEINQHEVELDKLTQHIVAEGLAVWSGTRNDIRHKKESLIVRGQANLLEDLEAKEDLERISLLFSDIERKKDLIELLGLAKNADGVRIFIGSENNLFSLSGSSVIAAPYMDEKNNLLGVIGVIGPKRLNYARIIPMVDYTAKTIGKII